MDLFVPPGMHNVRLLKLSLNTNKVTNMVEDYLTNNNAASKETVRSCFVSDFVLFFRVFTVILVRCTLCVFNK